MTFKREIQGVVVKVTGDKTASILVERKVVHSRYRRIVKHFKEYLVRDERSEAKVGDVVAAVECRPISKRESFHLKSILVAGAKSWYKVL